MIFLAINELGDNEDGRGYVPMPEAALSKLTERDRSVKFAGENGMQILSQRAYAVGTKLSVGIQAPAERAEAPFFFSRRMGVVVDCSPAGLAAEGHCLTIFFVGGKSES